MGTSMPAVVSPVTGAKAVLPWEQQEAAVPGCLGWHVDTQDPRKVLGAFLHHCLRTLPLTALSLLAVKGCDTRACR